MRNDFATFQFELQIDKPTTDLSGEITAMGVTRSP